MQKTLQATWRLLVLGYRTAEGFLIWSLWLALALLLVIQLWLYVSREIPIPAFVRNALSERLAAASLDATFARGRIDPSGRILIEDVQLRSRTSPDVLVRAGSIYVALNPWSLLAGDFEPSVVRASQVDFNVPAALSPSGRTDAVIRDVDLTLRVHERELELEQFNARIGRLHLSARGLVPIADWRRGPRRSLPLADFFSREYPRLSREFATWVARLDAFEGPHLHLEVAPAGPQRVTVTARFDAQSARLASPIVATARQLQAGTTLILGGDEPFPAALDLFVRRLDLPYGIHLADARLRLTGEADPAARDFHPAEALFSAGESRIDNFPEAASSASGLVRFPTDQGPLRGAFAARLADSVLAAEGEADLARRAGSVRVQGTIAPAALDLTPRFVGERLRQLVQLSQPVSLEAGITLSEGWKLDAVTGALATQRARFRGVDLDAARARGRFSGTSLTVEDIHLALGGYHAGGSYSMDTATRQFRFLLDGRLRPLAISGWFGPWWRNFFSGFEFGEPVAADVDVQGRWGAGRQTAVFVGVDAADPVIRTVPFERVRASIFTRPGYVEVRRFHGFRPEGEAHGTFTRTTGPDLRAMRRTAFDVVSSVDPVEVSRLFGPAGQAVIAPFTFSSAPSLTAAGHIDGPAGTETPRIDVGIEGGSTGGMQFLGFPFSNPAFAARIVDDRIEASRLEASLAEGRVAGTFVLTGRGAAQRLAFDGSLREARLGPAVMTLRSYLALRRGEPAPVPGEYVTKAANARLDLTLAAEGPARNVLGFMGAGQVDLSESELGELPLLGGLSKIFTFSALRFTRAGSAFRLERENLVFPELKLAGSNSALLATGTYSLNRPDPLNFGVKVYPFQESKGLIQSIADAILTPLSEFLEVKLTGSLQDPDWVFVAGPSNFLRQLTASETPQAPATPPSAPPDETPP